MATAGSVYAGRYDRGGSEDVGRGQWGSHYTRYHDVYIDRLIIKIMKQIAGFCDISRVTSTSKIILWVDGRYVQSSLVLDVSGVKAVKNRLHVAELWVL